MRFLAEISINELATCLQVDVDTLRVTQVYRPHLKLGQAAHFLTEPAPKKPPAKTAELPEKTTDLPEKTTEFPEKTTGSSAKMTKSSEKTTESYVSNSINYRFRFDWLRLGSFYIEGRLRLIRNRKKKVYNELSTTLKMNLMQCIETKGPIFKAVMGASNQIGTE